MPKDGGKQTRLIFHLSFDFGRDDESKLLNFHTPDKFCHVKYQDLDHVIGNCLNLIQEFLEQTDLSASGRSEMDKNLLPTMFFSKSDVKSAFRLISIKPSQR